MTQRILIAAIAGLLALSSSARDYEVETLTTGLSWPWSIAFLPDGGFLIGELDGQIRRLSADGAHGPDIAGVPPVYFKSQGGLFDVLPDPRFADNQTVYLSYAQGTPEANGTAVARARLVDNSLLDLTVIFRAAPDKDTPVHYGGRMAILKDGSLLVTVGDGFNYREAAQDRDSHLGKTVRIHTDGRAHADHPFADRPKIFTLGHRNPQGLATAPDGEIYLHEHGPKGGDEVNILRKGVNYGWPAITYGLDYNGAHVSPFTHWEGMAQPLHVWTPSIAPSGLAAYAGDVFPEWRGDLFTGGLVSRDLRRLEMKNGRIVKEHVMLGELDARIRDVRGGPDGLLYIVTDGPDGAVLRLRPVAEK